MHVRIRTLPTARLFASPLVTIVLAAIAGLLTLSIARAVVAEIRLVQSTHRVRAEIAQLSAEQASLSTLVARLRSPQALESDARLRLNVAKPGETLVVLPDPTASTTGATTTTRSTSVPRQWFTYFFETP
jgi:cell division protein FtsB